MDIPLHNSCSVTSSHPAGLLAVNKAEGIVEVLAQKRQLPSSEACQAYATDNFSWSVIAPQIKSVYEQAIADFARK